MHWNAYYNHANEPVHHVPFMFNRLGAPHLTQYWSRFICRQAYADKVEGIVGNEDAGQMSAWYVMSALGFYEAEHETARYWFGSPIIDEATLKVAGGQMHIVVENNSEQNKYIQRVWLNGKEYRKPWISHSDLIAGGELRFVMGGEKKLWY